MKILLLTDCMEAGGAETHLVQLACALRVHGHEVHLWCSGGRFAKQLEAEGVACHRLPPPSRNPLSLLARRQKLKRLVKREKIEVLHAHTRLTALLIRRMHRLGCAEIVTVHARFRSNAFLSRICYWGHATVAVSEDLRDYVTKTYRIPPEQVEVIPNGIDRNRFFPCDKKHEGIGILFASRLDADCSIGADLLCHLAPALCDRYPNLHIALAGGGSELARITRAASEVNRCIGRTAVTPLGWVDDMATLFGTADLFVGVSRAALEAAASGCAVILCGNEGYLGILDERTLPPASLSNFCARGEAPATAERLFGDLCALIDDPFRRDRCAHAGAAFVGEHLDAQALCRKTEAIYQKALPRTAVHRVLLCGYFGCRNLGDDAILQGILYELKASHSSVSPTVLSGSPMRDTRRLGIRAVHRKNPCSVVWAMLHSQAVILGGGSLLQNRTGRLSLFYYLGLLRLSRLLRRPSALFASGIGPLLGTQATARVRRSLGSVSHVGLRDTRSQKLLQEIGLPSSHLFLGADASFLLPLPPPSRALFLRRALGIPDRTDLLGVILRETATCEELNALLSAIRSVCRRHGLPPLITVLDCKQDRALSRLTARRWKDLGAVCVIPTGVQDALALLSSCRAVLSMRLHGMLLAARVGTPSFGISSDACDEKIPAFAEQTNQPWLPLATLSKERATQALETLLSSADAVRPHLQSLADEMQKNAQKDLAKLLQIVYNKR